MSMAIQFGALYRVTDGISRASESDGVAKIRQAAKLSLTQVDVGRTIARHDAEYIHLVVTDDDVLKFAKKQKELLKFELTADDTQDTLQAKLETRFPSAMTEKVDAALCGQRPSPDEAMALQLHLNDIRAYNAALGTMFEPPKGKAPKVLDVRA